MGNSTFIDPKVRGNYVDSTCTILKMMNIDIENVSCE